MKFIARKRLTFVGVLGKCVTEKGHLNRHLENHYLFARWRKTYMGCGTGNLVEKIFFKDMEDKKVGLKKKRNKV